MTDPILDEYALVPDVFDPAAYSNPALADALLPMLKQPLYQQALVRDLGDGQWSRHCQAGSRSLHRLTREILRKLKSQNRLLAAPLIATTTPADAAQWCHEALNSHATDPLNGIICADATKQQFAKRPEVASIERLTSTPWWRTGSSSATLDRKTTDYSAALSRILRQANSLMFIDPNLDPSQRSYRQFERLLAPLAARSPKPRIEIHRSFCRGDGPRRTFPDQQAWQSSFAPLAGTLKRLGLHAEVFCWQDFHDRHLITDIVGIHAGAGFDITTKANDTTTWACLSRDHRDQLQREYDPATRPGDLKHRFVVGQ